MGEHWNSGATRTGSSWGFPSPSLLLSTTAAGFSSLVWKLSEVSFVTDRGGSGAASAESSALTPGNASPGLYQGHLVRTRVHPPAKCSQMRLPAFCAPILSPCPLLLHWLFSGVKITHERSLTVASHSKWTVVCCFCILPIYPFSFSFRLLYLLLSRGFFSHKYSLSALDACFCYRSHTFCPFSQQSHDLQVIYSTKIGEVLSLSSASAQFPALLMLCARGQNKMSSTEKKFLSLW